MAKRQDAIPEITLGEQVPRQSASAAPAPTVPPVVQVTREIATVVIEVPICTNPPVRVSTACPHVAVHLTKSRAREGGKTLHALHWALKETEAKLGNGRPVRDRNDVLIWLLDQIGTATKA